MIQHIIQTLSSVAPLLSIVASTLAIIKSFSSNKKKQGKARKVTHDNFSTAIIGMKLVFIPLFLSSIMFYIIGMILVYLLKGLG